MFAKMSVLIGLTACALMVTAADAQERVRKVEFSIAGSMQAFVDEEETVHFMTMPIRVGTFVTPNVLIELEGIITGWDEAFTGGDTEVGYILSLNGSYNFQANERLMPFLLVGFGFTDSAPLGNAVAGNDFDDVTLTVLNAGAGMKFLVSDMAALRIEYRLQDFSGSKDVVSYYGTYTSDIDFTLHSMFFGVSLFF